MKGPTRKKEEAEAAGLSQRQNTAVWTWGRPAWGTGDGGRSPLGGTASSGVPAPDPALWDESSLVTLQVGVGGHLPGRRAAFEPTPRLVPVWGPVQDFMSLYDKPEIPLAMNE